LGRSNHNNTKMARFRKNLLREGQAEKQTDQGPKLEQAIVFVMKGRGISEKKDRSNRLPESGHLGSSE